MSASAGAHIDNDQRKHSDSNCSDGRDDLRGMTRFVTWDVDGTGGSAALYRSLPTPKHIVEIYKVAVEERAQHLDEYVYY